MRRRQSRLTRALADASLRTRVMAIAAILVALTSLLTGFLGTALLRSYLYSRADAQLGHFAAVASRVLERSDRPVRPDGPQQALPAQFLVEVVSADGQVRRAETPLDGADGPRLSAPQLRDEGSPFTAPAAGTPAHSWRVLVEPLAGATAIAAIADGDLSRRIEHPSGGTEVGRLADALDTMLGRIEVAYRARAEGEARALRSEDRMRQFVADASHELRTPLTSARGLAEFGLQQGSEASPGELLRLMGLINHEASRMGRLVADLLMLASLDSGRPLDRRHVDLASIAARAVQAARVVHPDRPIALAAEDPVIVYADTERLRQIIDNLIANAAQHTPPRSLVIVSVAGTGGIGEIIVADNGPGMTAEQAAHVFERFYRTDDARTRARGGTGLGLSIAASLAAAHGGDITLDTRPGEGAAFLVRLPLAASVESGT